MEKISDREEEFQSALLAYNVADDEASKKKAWDTMFLRVQDCCTNIGKKLLKGITISDDKLYERSLEATLKVMERIAVGVSPRKLSSICYLPTLAAFQGPKAIREDKEWTFSVRDENDICYENFEDDILEGLQ